MEFDALKSAWKGISAENKNTDILKAMIRENKHPVLKGIRRQMAIEITAWVLFLAGYYTMFDGHQKPLYANLLLVGAVLLLVLHSVTGYLSAKRPVNGENLRQSLLNYTSKMRKYALVSVASRAFTIIWLLLFFISTISFTTEKYILLAGLLLVIPVQVFFLWRIWNSRIRQLEAAIDAFNE